MHQRSDVYTRVSVQKQSRTTRRRLGTKHLTAAEFAESFDALLRSVLLFAEESEWVRSRHGCFAADTLSQTSGSRRMLG
jgi:hypothetical protein